MMKLLWSSCKLPIILGKNYIIVHHSMLGKKIYIIHLKSWIPLYFLSGPTPPSCFMMYYWRGTWKTYQKIYPSTLLQNQVSGRTIWLEQIVPTKWLELTLPFSNNFAIYFIFLMNRCLEFIPRLSSVRLKHMTELIFL